MEKGAEGAKIEIYKFSPRLLTISINDKSMNKEIEKELR